MYEGLKRLSDEGTRRGTEGWNGEVQNVFTEEKERERAKVAKSDTRMKSVRVH